MAEPTLFEHACVAAGWTRPADFLRAFEEAADLLGEAVTLTDRQARRWRGPCPPMPRARAWRVLHAMFACDPAELGFPGPPPGATVRGAPLLVQEGTGDVKRRAFMQDSAGAVAGSLASVRSASIGTTHVVELRDGLDALCRLDDSYGGDDIRPLAHKHLRRIERIINTTRYPETIGRQLQLLAGETAASCGWLHYDADSQGQARNYWGEALTTATVLGDEGLAIRVLGFLSMQASHEGRPRDGQNLARAAQEKAARYGSPVLQSLLASREAHALSLMGDYSTAKKKLADSMRLVERGARGRPCPSWAAFHGPAELDCAQGMLYAEAGRHHASAQFFRAALAHQDRTYGRNRALYRLTLARSLAHAGEADEAAAYAVESLDHLAEVESGRVTRRLREVTTLLRNVDAVTTRDAVGRLTQYIDSEGAA
ncbi:tetratricopeptide repeat protein [Streptomyces sp. LBUM 1476]|nr:tetratricopeptide repeat protein [Streptomyces sp. LBUM 1476]MBZ3915536.1 tetratricopeptide repeat protein [Streptomyces acidiscabies]